MRKGTFAGALALGVMLLTGTAQAAPPTNDNFANAASLSVAAGAPAFANGSNVDATLEPGEPQILGNGGSSVWFTWTADQNETVKIDTCGSDFDATLAVYAGTQLANLQLKGSGSCSGDEVVLGVQAGQSYKIAVDGRNGVQGSYDLNISESPPVVSMGSDVTLTEQNSGSSAAVFTLTLSEAVGTEVSAYLDTFDHAAAAPEDYTHVTQTVKFAPGQTTRTVSVPVLGDTEPELDEDFGLYLLIVQGGGAGIGRSYATATILNDDGPYPSLAIGDVEVIEGHAGTTMADLTVTLANPIPGKGATVEYETIGSSGSPDADYTSKASSLSFAPGETQEHISVPVHGDGVYEGDESFGVQLDWPQGATIAKGTGTVTIRDDDPQPKLSVAPASVDEERMAMTFTVSLVDGPPGQVVSVKYATREAGFLQSGRATSGLDFQPTSAGLAFFPGDTTRTFLVPILSDSEDEPDEQFVVELSDADNAAIAHGQATGTIVDDDPTRVSSPPAAKRRCVVPRLRGKRLSAARAALSKARCSLGKVARKRVKRRPGRVLRQSRRVGATLPVGTKVDVVVAKRRARLVRR